MKVYVVTGECDDDREIIGVCDSIEKATKLMNFWNRVESNTARIDEFDTDAWLDIFNSEKFYNVYCMADGSMLASRIDFGMDYSYEYELCRNKVHPYGLDGEYRTWVVAKSEDEAKKIASDLFAKYRAEKER